LAVRAGWLLLTAGCLLAPPTVASAQWVDAQMPRRGELQIGVAGSSSSVDQRIQPKGGVRLLSEVYGAMIDSRLEPGLLGLDSVLAGFYPLLGLPVPDSSTLGQVRYDVLVERTRVPISLSYSATDWLAAFAVVPLVKAKSFVVTQFDTATALAGNGDTAFGSNPSGFLQGLNDGIDSLQAVIDSGTLSPEEQAEAVALLEQANIMAGGLTSLAAEDYVVTDSSAAGRDLSGVYSTMQTGFAGFDVPVPALSLAQTVSVAEAVARTSGPEFGIEAPETRDTGLKLGDIEVGISLQPFNSFFATPRQPRPKVPIRLKLDLLYRFPTGATPAANRIFDPGTGQGQADAEFRGTFDIAYGSRLWMSLFAGYNLQFAADVERLVTSPEAPIQLGAYPSTVRWDPGDVLTLMAAPRFNLTRVISFAGLFRYQRHGADTVEPVDPLDPGAAFVPADLEDGTEFSATSVGFAARYSGTNWSGDRRPAVPMEVELRYLTVVSARDGYVPKRNVWEVATRFYWGIFR
jgi:hypothetical protein